MDRSYYLRLAVTRFLVYDDNYQDSGGYNLSLQFLTGRCAATISCGQTLPGNISDKAAMVTQKFSGNAGEAVQITGVTTSGTLCTRTNLYNPAGGLMGTTGCNSSNGPFVLPSTGSYTILVYDDNFQDSGGYNLNLQFLTGRCAGSISCGQTLPGNISDKAAMVTKKFSGNAGEAVQITGVTTSGTLCTRTNLYNPAGGFMGSTGCNSSNGPFVLPSTGSYTILVYDDNFQDSGGRTEPAVPDRSMCQLASVQSIQEWNDSRQGIDGDIWVRRDGRSGGDDYGSHEFGYPMHATQSLQPVGGLYGNSRVQSAWANYPAGHGRLYDSGV